MSEKKPIIKILRSSKDEFLGAYPNFPTNLKQCEEMKTKASAYDNTGICVKTTDNKVKK